MSDRDIIEILSPESWTKEHGGPLYKQLSEHIEAAIGCGELKEGQALPSEREMAIITSLSRVTVRKAVQKLVANGYVVQRQGSGTFIANKVEKIHQSLSRLTSFTEDMKRRRSETESKFISRGIFPPSQEEIITLGLGTNDNVTRISRLRFADGLPIAVERAALSAVILPDPENIGESLYQHLDKTGNKPVRAIQRISSAIIKPEDAELLQIPEGSAVLKIERISYLASDKVVEFTRSVYRSDAYDFVAELKSPNELG